MTLSDLQERLATCTPEQLRVLASYLDAMQLGVRLQIEVARERLGSTALQYADSESGRCPLPNLERAALAYAVAVLDQHSRGQR